MEKPESFVQSFIVKSESDGAAARAVLRAPEACLEFLLLSGSDLANSAVACS